MTKAVNHFMQRKKQPSIALGCFCMM